MNVNWLLKQFTGKSPDQIAHTMEVLGIKGRSGTTTRCPMALLLNFTEGSGRYIVGRRYLIYANGKRVEKVRTPENIREFMRRFDAGKYPDLVAPVKPCPPRAKPKKRGPRPPKPPGSEQRRLAALAGRFAP